MLDAWRAVLCSFGDMPGSGEPSLVLFEYITPEGVPCFFGDAFGFYKAMLDI